MSKILAPGRRIGYLIAPGAGHVEALMRGVRATSYAPPRFGSLIAPQRIEDGTADQIAADVRAETQGRRALALDRLGDALEPGAGQAPHVWAPMPELAAERLAGRCLREGVELTPPGAPVVDPALMSGVRLCLGAPRDREGLAQALDVVAGALADRANLGASSVI